MAAHNRVVFGLVVALASGGCGDDPAPGDVPVTLTLSGVPATGTAGSALSDLGITVVRGGKPGKNLTLELTVTGGGSVAPAIVKTDASGHAAFAWTLGQLPIENALEAVLVDDEVSTTATVDVATAGVITPEAFADVDAFLTTNTVEGSTEDLAFSPTGQLVMGAPGHLLAVASDGSVSFLEAGGEALVRPLGLAFSADGKLWIADGDLNALMVYEPGTPATIRKVTDHDGDEAFDAPNDVAVGPDGRVYLSDTCTGKVYAIDPATGAVVDRISFDHVTEGGPNGLVVGPGPTPELWITTENTGLFCGDTDVGITAPVAGLFRVPLTATGFGTRVDVATARAVFGDGLAFDASGNLYVLFDTADGLALDETIVDVLPRGATTLRRAFAAKGKVWANLAFAPDTYGATTMYLSLLKLPPFTQSRGVERVELGIEGAPLPPE